MKNTYTKFLRIVLIVFGVGLLLFAVLLLPRFASLAANYYKELAYLKIPVMIFVYISAVPFYVALCEGIRVCSTIIQNDPFSTQNLRSFNIASLCALTVSVMYFAGTGVMAFLEVSRPIVFVVGLVIGSCALIFTLLCAVLNQLLKKAIELREENDLTV